MTQEVWLPTKRNPNYFVSNTGKVKSVDRTVYVTRGTSSYAIRRVGQVLSPFKTTWGYLALRVGTGITVRVHTLVAEVFVSGWFDGSQVNHKDGNKKNNQASNLEWVTLSKNVQHAYDTGLHPKPIGERNGRSVLSTDMVRDILLLKGKLSGPKTAKRFNINHTTVYRIWSRERWGSVV